METQKTIIPAEQVKLSIEDQDEILKFVKDCWDKGKKDRQPYIDHAKACKKAYHCEMEPITSPELDWMSNKCLPWAYDAAESWFAHIHSTTIPKNDQIFTISGRTEEDHPGADVMQKYLEYRFERNKFATKLGEAERNLAIENHACLKVYWKEETTIRYEWVDEPVIQEVPDELTGQVYQVQTGTKKVRQGKEEQAFNNVWIDVIPLDNFVMYPIRGEFEKTTRIHETYRYYEDLMSSADKTNYFNLSEIKPDDERNSPSLDSEKNKADDKCQPKGLKIKEAWISRVKIGDKVYRNYVATIVNDKTLIRFQPFPSPRSPFVFSALRPDGNCFYGYGLNSKGLDILDAANEKFNAWLDDGQMTQHGAHKYYDDGVFNPNNVVRRPGAMIKMGGPDSVAGNLIPLIDDKSNQQQLMQDLAALKVEFETVTVPKVVKGMIEVERNTTATEQTLAQNNSSGKMHIDAYHINESILEPVLALSYQAIYDRFQIDPTIEEEIQTITQPKDPQTGAPLQELPILPLPNVDIRIVGYQNVIRKQESLMAMGQAIPQLAQSPAGQYLKWANLAEDTFNLMDLDSDRLLMNDEERQQADAAAQQAAERQQQLMEQEAVGKIENDKQKMAQEFQLKSQQQQMDFQIKQVELEIKRMELALKAKDLEVKEQQAQQQAQLAEQQAQHQAAMDVHGAHLSERSADFTEKQAQKEGKDAKSGG